MTIQFFSSCYLWFDIHFPLCIIRNPLELLLGQKFIFFWLGAIILCNKLHWYCELWYQFLFSYLPVHHYTWCVIKSYVHYNFHWNIWINNVTVYAVYMFHICTVYVACMKNTGIIRHSIWVMYGSYIVHMHSVYVSYVVHI